MRVAAVAAAQKKRLGSEKGAGKKEACSTREGYLLAGHGDGSGGEYTIDEWAKACGTINYEIVTRIGTRVPRIYPRE